MLTIYRQLCTDDARAALALADALGRHHGMAQMNARLHFGTRPNNRVFKFGSLAYLRS